MNREALSAFRNFEPGPHDAWIFDNPKLVKKVEWQIANFPALVLPSLERPIVICGIYFEFGVGELWMLVGKEFRRASPIIAQQHAQLCKMCVEAFKLHRLNMVVDSRRQDAKFYAEKIGFEYEATLKRSGPRGEDQDYYMWKERNGEND